MKKKLLIALCSLAVIFTACKKPVEPTPTPEPVDYTVNYVGNYIGQFTLTITSMNNQPQTGLSFPVDSIKLDIAKGEAVNAITATVTVDNESHQTVGTATEEKAQFETVSLKIDKPDQNYTFDLNIVMESTPVVAGTLNITGSFSGKGMAEIMGQLQIFDEVSGTISGVLNKH